MRSKWLLGFAAFLLLGYFALRLLTNNAGRVPDHLSAPEGFRLEVAAGPPLVERPMIVDMDERGRLYVAESSGSNDPVEQQLRERPHSILRLEDADGDGVFDRRTVFADKMMLPEGVLWMDGSVYVAAPPSIWKLTDTDDDGVADERVEWFDGKTLTNCANDLHGPYEGPDGWIYWCKGAFAEQTYERPGGKPLVTRAAHIFRRRPEGGLVEPVLTGGMDNPVEVAFSPEGERFLTATFLQHPELGRRDGLIHALYGGVYGKVHGVTDEHPQTGRLQAPMSHLGPAAPVGLSYYRSGVFGEDYRGNLFATMFYLNKITRHELSPDGASFTTRDSDFLVSTSSDFHPTDVLEDADGSLLIVDTGGWYKLCCPTSQLAKSDVLGAIYRLRREGAPGPEDPRGLLLDWDAMTPDSLAELLADDRPAVADRAVRELARRGPASLGALRRRIVSDSPAVAKQRAVWALTRITGAEARAGVRTALADPDPAVRQAAVHGAAIWRDGAALEELLQALDSNHPPLQRAAAEALGRLGEASAVAPLLDAAGRSADEALTHSLTFALIEINDPTATRKGLRSSLLGTRRAALIALDQMEAGRLAPSEIVPLLSSREPLLRESANWIAQRHPEWGGAVTSFLRRRLRERGLDGDEWEQLHAQLVRFGKEPRVQKLLAETVRRGSPQARKTALDVMAEVPLDSAPPSWVTALAALLAKPASDELGRLAVDAARALQRLDQPVPELQRALAELAKKEGAPAAVRVEALAAAAGGMPTLDREMFALLLAALDPEKSVAMRSAAATALAAAPLETGQLLALADRLQTTGPLETPVVLAAFERSSDEEVGERLLTALETAESRGSLRPDLVETALANYPASVRERRKALLASLDHDRAQQQERLEELLASLDEGDVRRGQAVFNSAKAACSSCHKIGYLGGRVGPDLTRIGEIRGERDLLEAVVYPSASFVRSYEPVIVQTADEIHSGVPLEETDATILLATGAETQVRIARAEIEEMRPGAVSVMPSGLEGQLSQRELADLIAFLKATRWGPG